MYLVGGVYSSTVTVVNTKTGVVSTGPSLLDGRYSCAVASSDDEIFVCGGRGVNASMLKSCERLKVGRWACRG